MEQDACHWPTGQGERTDLVLGSVSAVSWGRWCLCSPEEKASSSHMIVDERRRPRRNARRPRQDHADSCVVSSDDEEVSRDRDVYVTTHTPRHAREEAAAGLRPSGTVSCPICMDGYSEIVQNGRLIVSTECGHVFCSQCLRDSLKNANTCPTCRKKINHKRYHPIYI
ncbi:E3 ubiquitin-protein ligase RNF4 isoform X8 [Panthera tigris]|uniref:E3 ubiquitin-protein ligase RNF4 isoform X8 n=1 Tax=Panthera tigris TaxID=9694 RepID=UPI001C6FADCC|nr:E3 ubiquitin-protein ligase RNF4 isoform X8 [Panthera tigris]